MKKILFILSAFPLYAFALDSNSNLKSVVMLFLDLINTLTPVVASLALLVFFWGLVKFIYKAGDASAHEEGRNLMVYGIIGLFVMVSVFGIIRFFQKDLGVSNPNSFIPKIQTWK